MEFILKCILYLTGRISRDKGKEEEEVNKRTAKRKKSLVNCGPNDPPDYYNYTHFIYYYNDLKKHAIFIIFVWHITNISHIITPDF